MDCFSGENECGVTPFIRIVSAVSYEHLIDEMDAVVS